MGTAQMVERKAGLVRLGWYAGSAIALFLGAVVLIMAYRDGFAALEDARAQRLQAHRAVALQVERRQHLAALLRRPGAGPIILATGNEGEAQAGLQRHLTAALGAASAEIASLEVLPAGTADGYRRISLRADFTVDLSGLRKLLHDLEFGLPLATIERLRVRAAGPRAIGTDRRLSVDLHIVALQEPPGP